VNSGSASDSTFYVDFLHAGFVSDSSGANVVIGVTGDPITNGMLATFTGTGQNAGNQTSTDVISPLEPAEMILKYTPGFGGAALRYENTNSNARLVYLAFGLEGIAGPQEESASVLLDNMLAWLGGETGILDRDDSRQVFPGDFILNQNFPNPFNSHTSIQYQLPKSGRVNLTIYNMLGQKIRTLIDQILQAGHFHVTWDGKDDAGKAAASGVYFYQLDAGNFSEVKKMLFLQ